MRLLTGVLVFLLIAPPAFANSGLPSACEIVDRTEAERVLGAPLGPPILPYSYGDREVCVGVCPMMGPDCGFEVGNPPDSGAATSLAIYLRVPEPGDWPQIPQGVRLTIKHLAWPRGRATWVFWNDRSFGSLYIAVGRRAQLTVNLSGIRDSAIALGSARAIAVRAASRLQPK